MIKVLSILCLAAVLGVVTATSSSCAVGLAIGTNAWCALPLFWFIGFPVALVFAVFLGGPAALLFRRLHLAHWWQFTIGGAVIAMPFWFELARPFVSPRWQQSGFFDSVNYLGSGALTGLYSWWMMRKLRPIPPPAALEIKP